MTLKPALVLMGIKHCGKSTQGRLLAAHFACPFIDTDDEVTALTGMAPRALYVAKGEQAFKDAEAAVCRQLAERFSAASRQNEEPGSSYAAVIATGGGIITNEPALSVLAAFSQFVFLQADEKMALSRIVREASFLSNGKIKNLPAYIARENPASLADVEAIFHRFYEERTARYARWQAITVEMQALPPEENMKSILRQLQAAL